MNSRQHPILRTERLILRLADQKDIPAILRYYHENETRFSPTDPPKPEGFHTEKFWSARVRKSQEEFEAEQSLRFFLFETANDSTVVGTANFTQLCRGAFQACYLGYSINGKHEGQGLMTEALTAAIRYVFSDLNFHRIMANHLPENQRSARLLKRLGFAVEGLAPNYLLINGQWRDHVLTALTNTEWKSTR